MRGPNNAAASSSTRSRGGGAAMAAFKQDLLRNLLLGLRGRTAEAAACPFDAMSLQERKRAVKCSADVAMAAARRGAGGRVRWPKAILAAAAASSTQSPGGGTRKVIRKSVCKCKRRRVDAKRIRGAYAAAASFDVARRLVRRRTMALRKVIPGGNAAAMDEAALLRETMDYVVHLRAQVDVLRHVSAAVQRSTFLRSGPGSFSSHERIVMIPGSEDREGNASQTRSWGMGDRSDGDQRTDLRARVVMVKNCCNQY